MNARKSMLKHLSILLVLCLFLIINNVKSEASVRSPNISIIPSPTSLVEFEGKYQISANTVIHHSVSAQSEAKYLANVLMPAMGYRLALNSEELANTPGIFLEVTDQVMAKEGYELEVNKQGVHIKANTRAGLFYAIQTLRQLLPVQIFASEKQEQNWDISFVKIVDQPRFEWRGMHLDVSRHIMPVAFVKKFIDLLALHKMNRFHWHLSEDQGWRIEIKKYPKLTEVGAWRDETAVPSKNERTLLDDILFWREPVVTYDGIPYGGFYSQDEVREIVSYAQQRHIVVVPAIELPGHAQAALTAYPEFASSDEKIKVMTKWGVSHHIFSPETKTINFLKDILTEIMALFPSQYIHIGADEVDKTLWENNPEIQKLIKSRGLSDENEMQSWFIEQIDVFLEKNGRRMLAWYEDGMLDGNLTKGAIIMPWRGGDTGVDAVNSTQDVVMAHGDYTYFDYYQSESEHEPKAMGGYIPLEKVYHYNPIPQHINKQQAQQILGAQGQLWTEYMKTPEHVEYMAFPRAVALSEVLWLNQNEQLRDYQAFLKRLTVHQKRLDLMSVNYRSLNKNN